MSCRGPSVSIMRELSARASRARPIGRTRRATRFPPSRAAPASPRSPPCPPCRSPDARSRPQTRIFCLERGDRLRQCLEFAPFLERELQFRARPGARRRLPGRRRRRGAPGLDRRGTLPRLQPLPVLVAADVLCNSPSPSNTSVLVTTWSRNVRSWLTMSSVPGNSTSSDSTQLERLDVEIVGRLVEHQDVGGLRQQPREQQPVALAARQRLHRRSRALGRETESPRGSRARAARRRRPSRCRCRRPPCRRPFVRDRAARAADRSTRSARSLPR